MLCVVLPLCCCLLLGIDPLPVDKMYIMVQKEGCMPRYVAMRGTSQLEGFHKHLISLFVGANYSAELAGALVTMFTFR